MKYEVVLKHFLTYKQEYFYKHNVFTFTNSVIFHILKRKHKSFAAEDCCIFSCSSLVNFCPEDEGNIFLRKSVPTVCIHCHNPDRELPPTTLKLCVFQFLQRLWGGLLGNEVEQDNNNENEPYSKCWPRDWLPKDCPGVRVIALNYTTDPYLWRPPWVTKRNRLATLQTGLARCILSRFDIKLREEFCIVNIQVALSVQ